MRSEIATPGYTRLQIALHIVGAFCYQFVLRDGILARMRRAWG